MNRESIDFPAKYSDEQATLIFFGSTDSSFLRVTYNWAKEFEAAVSDLIAQANRATGYTRWTMLGDHEMLIETGGLRVGVEICVDHLSGPGNRGLRGQLEREGVASGLRAGEYHPLDLQLVVSAGMSLAFGPIERGYAPQRAKEDPYGRVWFTLPDGRGCALWLEEDSRWIVLMFAVEVEPSL